MTRLVVTLIAAGTTAATAQALPDHAAFGTVLGRVWHEGMIDYATLAEHRGELDAYIGQLAAVEPAALDEAPAEARLAFWINAYNACALRLVVDHYPIERRGGVSGIINSVKGYPANSIRQIPDTWSRTFCPVAGEARSLDGIEHGVIRPMGDPRIHFAVNCAARSCPELAAEPYTADRLDEQLDAAVRRLVGDPRHFELRREGRRPVMHVNKVLDWYRDDFGGTEGVAAFLAGYLSPEDARYVGERGPAEVTFRDYDWTLNDTAVWGTRR